MSLLFLSPTSRRSLDLLTNELDSLGIIYNALPSRKLQADFQAWALGLYPDLWAELEKKGRQGTDETGINFRISRDLRA